MGTISVIPAQTGTQRLSRPIAKELGARLRGHDVVGNREPDSCSFANEPNLRESGGR
jgi:hypothetical protein